MSEIPPLPPVDQTVREMETPSEAWRKAALQGEPTPERHAALRQQAACLNTVRLVPADAPALRAERPRVVAWNLERCKHVEETAAVLRREQADICLLTEMDLGMARSGNRDTTGDLARLLGMGHVYGTEFIELGHGDFREQALHGGTPNRDGLHGNAVLARFPIDRALVLPLDNDGFWFWNKDAGDQRRIGGRIAIAVRLLLPQPVWVVSVHYESRLGPPERSEETKVLLAHLDRLTGSEPVLIGGDFNCKGLQEEGVEGEALLTRPETVEPMFARLREAGFDWRTCNTSNLTTRNHAWTIEEYRAFKKIDWFFARGVECRAPAVIPAVDAKGRNISDHEAIAVTLALPAT
ncbi:endonuclease/exonuclease/phosphatase family protein [Roseibium salinum]|uniref:Endonuclease/exonuclease/phosphatase family protein n=1 Tax=Roseibium salinum TaxID=1604349 RepID=A0ABT3R8T5_9HYPH|nr:endonuclease/exonuclease/phosphatase family protein [Roseibium sp. DSM 29163]MCX2725524.1 endonuclease/exonuclease/phosphatase family protein [Roseibium sp. DSM 29163]MDN3720688.1 endonuclease/exonuclease/phosphatase family protein [Roseibium salinum]